jgi:glycerophosphoryl diester phosphodiesterase
VLERIRTLTGDRPASMPRLNIETKLDPRQPALSPEPAAFADAILEVIRNAGMTGQVTLQSFDWRTLRHLHEVEPGIPTACLTTRGSANDNVRDGLWTAGLSIADHASVAAMAKAGGCTIWSPNFNNLQQSDVEDAQAIGMKVVPWTVNLQPDMQRLLDWGVDGLITDYPDRLREVMAQRRMALPASLAR